MCRNTPSAMRGEGRASHDGFGLSSGNAGVDVANRRPRSRRRSPVPIGCVDGKGIVRSIRAITGVRPKASLADARPMRLRDRDRDRISELMCQECPFSGLQERLVWVEGLVVVKRTHRERTSQCRTPYSPLRKPAGSSDSPQEPWHSSGTPAVVLASSN